ncbi:MAG: dienelactone hydrolase family protein [Planctomycetaceae bacterium]
MFPFLARSFDRLLSRWLAKRVGRPETDLPRPEFVPNSPDDLVWPEPIEPTTEPFKKDLSRFQAPSPVKTFCRECETIHGRMLGPDDSQHAVVILHGAYGEYVNCEMMARAFVKQGFRAIIPVAPFHLERTAEGVKSGNMFFWSSELVVSGVAQWLIDVHGLISWLRTQGVKRVGLVGYSIGSLTAGLAATLWPELDFVIPLAPVGHHVEAIERSPSAAKFWPWMCDLPQAQKELFDRWAPRYRDFVAKRAHFFITLFDELQPVALQQEWRNAWNNPPQSEFRHGHISICFSRVLYRELEKFAAEMR